MAYRNLVNLTALSAAQVWRHVTDFLTSRNGIADYSATGLGWTVHDQQLAVDRDNPTVGDWLVLASSGEDGDETRYLQLSYQTVANSIIKIRSGLYWNATSNAWVSVYHTADQGCGLSSGTAFNLYIYGDLSGFSVLVGNGTTLYGYNFDRPADTMHDQTVALSLGAVTAGSNRTVSVAAVPASWVVGAKLYIRDDAAMEIATIASISGTDVVLASLSNGYASGARLSRDYASFISTAGQFINAGYGQIKKDGANSVSLSGYNYTGESVSAADPDPLNDDYLTSYSELYSTLTPNGFFGRHRNILVVSSNLTAGSLVTADDGSQWRALSVSANGNKTLLFKEV